MNKMSLSEELSWRDFIKDHTFDDLTWLDTPRTFYLGIDPSGDSLQIGNLAVYMLARQLIKYGWMPILLVGGATGLIGDPGGKQDERQLKTHEEIEANVAALKSQIEKLFSGEKFETVNNYDWFKDLGYLEFLRDVGKYYSMTELMQRDYIATRMGEKGSGISYAEFSYSLIQGYDYYWLFKNKGVELQIGGSDQWGNMISGVPLIRKKEGMEVHALSMPLVINKATGQKFGKSEAGVVWLDPKKTSPAQFYQFWINVDDESAFDYLKIYTDLNKDEISDVITRAKAAPAERIAQNVLATEVTILVHGDEVMKQAEQITDVLTGKVKIDEVSEAVIEAIRSELPSAKVAPDSSLVEVLVSTGLASSKTEATRLIVGKAVYINGQVTTDDKLSTDNFQNGKLLIRRGKAFKDTALVELN
jgi:tyrosyl-tRNA synthetase